MGSIDIPQRQTVALVRNIGGKVEFADYPVPVPKSNEVLAKVLYTGVCHSGTCKFEFARRKIATNMAHEPAPNDEHQKTSIPELAPQPAQMAIQSQISSFHTLADTKASVEL
jgi:hypothetical protein